MAAAALVSVILLGLALSGLHPFDRGLGRAEWLSIAWLVGYAWISSLLHLVVAISNEMPPWSWWLPFAALIAPILPMAAKPRADAKPNPYAPRTEHPVRSGRALGIGLSTGVAIQLVYVVATTFSRGLEWDGLYVWAIKTKALLVDGSRPGFLLAMLKDEAWDFTNQEYPLGLPFLEGWVSVWQGGFAEQPLKAISPVFLAALAILLWGHGRRHGQELAAVGPLLLVTSPLMIDLARSGYADVPIATLFAGSTIAVIEWVETRDSRWAWLVCASSAGLVGTKREGLLLALCLALAGGATLFAIGRRRFAGLVVASIAAGTLVGLGPWALFLLRHDIGRGMFDSPSPTYLLQNLDRLGTVLPLLSRLLVDETRYGLLWPLLGALVLLRFRRLREPSVAFLALLLMGGLAASLLPFLLTRAHVLTHALTALDRLLLQLTPIAALLVMRLVHRPSLSPDQRSTILRSSTNRFTASAK